MKKDNKIKIFIIILITIILMGVSSIAIYSNICAPKFYDYFIDTGIKYLTDGKYEEAILAFNKAIKIDEKTTEARVYLAEGYIGNNEHDKAIDVLEEAQDLDIKNEDLLKEILEILNVIDSDIAYEFLERFINAVGKNNISEYIQELLNSAYESPSSPMVYPVPGTYIDKISLRLKLDKIKVGHSFYYTIDGSEPTKESNKYIGKIDISESTTVKVIGYNKNNESTEVIALDYIIDNSVLEDIKQLITEAQNLSNRVEEGSNIGNCIQGTKDDFVSKINYSKQYLSKDLITYDDANKLYTDLQDAIQDFKNNIIEKTDKSELVATINQAQDLYNKAKEGTNMNEYKLGAKNILLESINSAKKINDKLIAKQIYIDNEIKELKNSIEKFRNSKNKDLRKIISNKFIITKNDYSEDSYSVYRFGNSDSEWFDYGGKYHKMIDYKILKERIEGNKIYWTIKPYDKFYNYIEKDVIIEVIDDMTIKTNITNGNMQTVDLLSFEEFIFSGGDQDWY